NRGHGGARVSERGGHGRVGGAAERVPRRVVAARGGVSGARGRLRHVHGAGCWRAPAAAGCAARTRREGRRRAVRQSLGRCAARAALAAAGPGAARAQETRRGDTRPPPPPPGPEPTPGAELPPIPLPAEPHTAAAGLLIHVERFAITGSTVFRDDEL